MNTIRGLLLPFPKLAEVAEVMTKLLVGLQIAVVFVVGCQRSLTFGTKTPLSQGEYCDIAAALGMNPNAGMTFFGMAADHGRLTTTVYCRIDIPELCAAGQLDHSWTRLVPTSKSDVSVGLQHDRAIAQLTSQRVQELLPWWNVKGSTGSHTVYNSNSDSSRFCAVSIESGTAVFYVVAIFEHHKLPTRLVNIMQMGEPALNKDWLPGGGDINVRIGVEIQDTKPVGVNIPETDSP